MTRDPAPVPATRVRARATLPGAALLVAALAATSSDAHAQSLRGIVVDAETRQPLAGTAIRLITAEDSVVERTVANEDGRFLIEAPRAGPWRVGLERIGYTSPVLGPIELGDGMVQDVEIRLSVTAIPLEALTVTAEPRIAALEDVGYYRRRNGAFGAFVDRLEIEKYPTIRTSDAFRRIAGARVVYGPGGQEYVVLRGGTSSSLSSALCLPKVYLDGVQVHQFDWREITPMDIEGIEVFRGTAEVPMQWGGSDATCGVILVWTRRGD